MFSCETCGKTSRRGKNELKRCKHHFCSRSCAGKYYNTHKITGVRRSLLEKWLEEKLSEQYPKLEILFNEKKAIGSELDILIPSLHLAFELNGIFHYQPIFGRRKFERIINNDQSKQDGCIARKIELIVLDVSSQTKFTERSSTQYLERISREIAKRIK